MNKVEITMEKKSEDERFKTIKFSMRKWSYSAINYEKNKWTICWLETPHGTNYMTWAFSCVNDESKVDVKVLQVMCCILWHNRQMGHVVL
jgi:hypothetical protein